MNSMEDVWFKKFIFGDNKKEFNLLEDTEIKEEVIRRESHSFVDDKQASKTEDYEFNLHKHWKDEEDRTGYDSKPIGGFSNW